MKNYKIAVIPGDGTGPEVVNEGLKVLEAVAQKCGFKYETASFDFANEAIVGRRLYLRWYYGENISSRRQ